MTFQDAVDLVMDAKPQFAVDVASEIIAGMPANDANLMGPDLLEMAIRRSVIVIDVE